MCRRVRVSDGWCLAPGASFPRRRLRHEGGEGNRGHADRDQVRESARIDDDHGEKFRRHDDGLDVHDRLGHDACRSRHQQNRPECAQGRRAIDREVYPCTERGSVGISQVDYAGRRQRSEYLERQPQRLVDRGISMASQRIMRTSVAIAATLIIGVPSLASAQARGAAPAAGGQAPAQGAAGRGRGAVQYFNPAPGAKDLKSVLFNWAWYMGMLRSNEEYDVLMTLDYQGKGTVQIAGQPCNVSMYRSDISYRASG